MSREFKDRHQEHIESECTKHERHSLEALVDAEEGGKQGGGSLLKCPHVSESRDTTKSDPGHMVPILVFWPRVKTVHIVKLTFHIWLAHAGQTSFKVSLQMNE